MKIIDDFAKLHSLMADYRRDNRWMFRGHASVEWKLIPKAGRPPYNKRDDLDNLLAWSRRAAYSCSVTVMVMLWRSSARRTSGCDGAVPDLSAPREIHGGIPQQDLT